MVGRRTRTDTGGPSSSRLIWSGMLPVDNHGLLGGIPVEDAVRAAHGLVPERHQDVVPAGVRRLRDVRGRGVGVGVGVRVGHADDLEAPLLGIPVGPQVVAWIDLVDPGRRRRVAARVEDLRPPVGVATEEAAGLEGQPVEAVADQLEPRPAGEAQHGADATVGPVASGRSNGSVVASNRRARHDYDVLDTVEAGIALQGSEVKALRTAQVNLKDSYAYVTRGEIWLKGVHIAPYGHSTGVDGHDPERERKLLLHRHEIDRLRVRVERDHLTLVPLDVHFRDGRAKVELALVRGRRRHDKRHALAERDAKREAERAMSRRGER